MKSNKSFFNNDEGVSPIVATLVLIVVAIIGAAAVGLIMGSFSSNVSKQAGTAGGDQAATQVIMGGSTTVYPLAQIMANTYMQNNTGVKIIVQAGGSGAGETGVAQGALDIGMASEDIFTKQAALVAKYPTLQQKTIGGSGVVFISNAAFPITTVDKAELTTAYTSGSGTLSTVAIAQGHVYTRSESSGTADAVGVYLLGDKTKAYPSATNHLVGCSGNPGVLAAVQADTVACIGFVDYGFAASATGIKIADVKDGATTYTTSHANILTALKAYFANGATATSSAYPVGLVRPLNLLTLGAPSAVESSIIAWFNQPNNEYAWGLCGYDSNADIGV